MPVTRHEALCIRCDQVKPRSSKYWRKRAGCRDGLEPRVCKRCRTEETREAGKLARAEERSGIHHSRSEQTKLCALCHGMPHRVDGAMCRRCGLRAAVEAKPEFVLRRFA